MTEGDYHRDNTAPVKIKPWSEINQQKTLQWVNYILDLILGWMDPFGVKLLYNPYMLGGVLCRGRRGGGGTTIFFLPKKFVIFPDTG